MEEVVFDQVLLAVGRSPNVDNMGLEELGIELDSHGRIETDDYLATSMPTIYRPGSCPCGLE